LLHLFDPQSHRGHDTKHVCGGTHKIFFVEVPKQLYSLVVLNPARFT